MLQKDYGLEAREIGRRRMRRNAVIPFVSSQTRKLKNDKDCQKVGLFGGLLLCHSPICRTKIIKTNGRIMS